MQWLLLSVSLYLFAAPIPLRSVPNPVSISVAIPCAGSHFQYLQALLDLYAKQTVFPDEVVISLSSVEKLVPEEIDALEKGSYPFPVQLIRSTGKQSAGLNRMIAVRSASGDVIAFQDADDLPHPQRIEIVKYFFENYKIDHLLHNFLEDGVDFCPQERTMIPLYQFHSYNKLAAHPLFNNKIHNGNVCCRREIFNRVQWEDVASLACDHDVLFNYNVYKEYRLISVAIPCGLVTWRWRLSAFTGTNSHWP